MRAIICTRYGTPDVLQLIDVEKPVPKDDEVLIRIEAASVTAADTMMRKGTPFYGRLFIGLTKPKHPIPGTGFAGTVEERGRDVTTFDVGDDVFGETGVLFSTNAEYVCVPEDSLILEKPAVLSFEEAAPLCDGALTSMNFLRDVSRVDIGQKVLINGASGSLGTAAVQLAKHFGANVTGVCSTKNVDLVRSLGADAVIDYTEADFTSMGEKWDVIYDTVGKASFTSCRQALSHDGVYLSPVLEMPLLLRMMWTSRFGSQKAKFSATGLRPVPELRVLLKELVEIIKSGKVRTIIDRSYPLAETADAHRYVETGHKKGNVVVLPSSSAQEPVK